MFVFVHIFSIQSFLNGDKDLLTFYLYIQNNKHFAISYITWLSNFDFEWWISYEKVILKIGVAFAHKWQTQLCEKIKKATPLIQGEFILI